MSSVKIKNPGDISDEQLVARVQAGEYEYFGILFKRHIRLIKHIALINSPDNENEDALSEGFLSFFKAVKLYSPEKGASFKTYFSITVKSDMLDLYKKKTAKRRIPDDIFSSIDVDEVEDADNPESLLIRKESIKSFFDNAKSKLSSFEYTVFCDRYFGKSYAEISAETGKSKKAIGAALVRARKKIGKV